jgi:putative ABC transport system permease protein
MRSGPGRLLRALGALLVRGPSAPYVLGDLEEAMRRELERGVARGRARRRYVVNAVASGFRLLGERVRAHAGRSSGLGVSWLDAKLGVRMLAKYPGLTVVGGVAIAVAVASGTFVFGVFSNFLHPDVPLPEAETLVGVQNRDVETGLFEQQSVHDFVAWRRQLRTIEGLSAFALAERNLMVGEGSAEPVEMAEMSASAFRTLRVAPLLGRTLLESDEAPGAADVVVLGHDLWRSRFGGDAAVLGLTVRVGGTSATVVGVMPEGFGFPVREQLWAPLRVDVLAHAPRQGPAITMFGRVAGGFTIEQAHAELLAVGSTVEREPGVAALRPRALWYPHMIAPPGGTETQVVQSMLAVLMLIASVNVATLVFARAATRESEIAVRAALGASRTRILMQLFVEALVLVAVATLVGLVVARLVLAWGTGVLMAGFNYRTPFWWKIELGARTLLYVAASALLATIVVGVVPALKVTSGLGRGLQQAAARGSTIRFGGVWTSVVLFQVALAVAVLPMVAYLASDAVRYGLSDPAIAAEEFLTVRLERDRAATETDAGLERARFAGFLEELRRRLLAEPEALAVTHASHLPGMEHERLPLEIEGIDAEAAAENPPHAGTASVAPGFFEALGSPVRAGREFHSGDEGAAVLVNESFVAAWLGGQNAVGRRVRVRSSSEEPQPWWEVVGVVPDFGTEPYDAENARLYFPLVAGSTDAVRVAVHLGPGAESFGRRLREVVADIDPTVRASDLMRLDQLGAARRRLLTGIVGFAASLAAVALLLSAAGTYALMSFIVARRTREIGIRAALGADPRQLLGGILGRAARQLGAGALIGSAMGVYASSDWLATEGPGPLLIAALIPLATGLLACGVPAARALRVEPTEALRNE